jgi:hypothetical protein
MIIKFPRNTTKGSNVVAVPAARDFSSHCPAEIKEKYMHISVRYLHNTKCIKYYLKWVETE